jgi:hypothetical protein
VLSMVPANGPNSCGSVSGVPVGVIGKERQAGATERPVSAGTARLGRAMCGYAMILPYVEPQKRSLPRLRN